MPRVMKTVVPRIRKSIAERGVLVSMGRSVLLPMHLWQEYRKAKKTSAVVPRSDFDVQYGVDTDGDINGWTHLSDLNIPSSNWIYGRDYAPIEPERFRAIFTRLNIGFQDFVFVDFGSGKGRALLLASEFPFKRVVGLEFSPELHQIAQANIRLYASQRKSGPVESICADFLEFQIPADPAVFFFSIPASTGCSRSCWKGSESHFWLRREWRTWSTSRPPNQRKRCSILPSGWRQSQKAPSAITSSIERVRRAGRLVRPSMPAHARSISFLVVNFSMRSGLIRYPVPVSSRIEIIPCGDTSTSGSMMSSFQ
jgi:hypothetical protein